MNKFLIYFQYQGDERCQNTYSAFCKTDNEDEVESKILALPNYTTLEDLCKGDFQEYFEGDEDYDEDDDWVGIAVENITDDEYVSNSDWFNNLTCLIDER